MDALKIVLCLGEALVAGIAVYLIALPLWEGWKRSRLPVVTVHATVQSREVFVDERIGFRMTVTWRGPQNQRQVKTVFCTDSGEQITVYAPYSRYAQLQKGVRGVLTHQGTKLEEFIPDTPGGE